MVCISPFFLHLAWVVFYDKAFLWCPLLILSLWFLTYEFESSSSFANPLCKSDRHHSMFFQCLWLLCFIIVTTVFCIYYSYLKSLSVLCNVHLTYEMRQYNDFDVCCYLFIYYIFHFLSDSKGKGVQLLRCPGWISSSHDHLSGQYLYHAHFVWTILTTDSSKNILTKLLYMDIEKSRSCNSDRLMVTYL